ncbi:MAG: hypothetical protein JXR25_06485 [Pontiellaceae bacterium]|nr:hypothetical protein [Pontiellaceae bacterium]MBN2784456.1 hypothetical protein [Pontiellaceae bacterium]
MIMLDLEKSVAIVQLTGKPSFEDVRCKIEELLNHPDHINGMDELWDFSNADMTSLRENELRMLSFFIGQHTDRIAKRTALVLGRDVDYGIARMWEVYAGHQAPQERHLFRSLDDAFSWLSA